MLATLVDDNRRASVDTLIRLAKRQMVHANKLDVKAGGTRHADTLVENLIQARKCIIQQETVLKCVVIILFKNERVRDICFRAVHRHAQWTNRAH
jgi:hypothetical protein